MDIIPISIYQSYINKNYGKRRKSRKSPPPCFGDFLLSLMVQPTLFVSIRVLYECIMYVMEYVAYRSCTCQKGLCQKCLSQWRRQNVKTARSFPGKYGRKSGHQLRTLRMPEGEGSLWLVRRSGIPRGTACGILILAGTVSAFTPISVNKCIQCEHFTTKQKVKYMYN